jgi:hypothetical protein
MSPANYAQAGTNELPLSWRAVQLFGAGLGLALWFMLWLSSVSAVPLIVLLLLGFAVGWMADWKHLSLERCFPHNIMVIAGALALAGVIWSTLRLWGIWMEVRRLLNAPEFAPASDSFASSIYRPCSRCWPGFEPGS